MLKLREIVSLIERRFPTRNKMRKIESLSELRDLAKYQDDDKMYVRWSRGPQKDLEMGGKSRDYKQDFQHEGLSAVEFDPNWPDEDVIEIISDYGGPAMGEDDKIER